MFDFGVPADPVPDPVPDPAPDPAPDTTHLEDKAKRQEDSPKPRENSDDQSNPYSLFDFGAEPLPETAQPKPQAPPTDKAASSKPASTSKTTPAAAAQASEAQTAATTTPAADGDDDPFAKFMAKPGEWECPGCLLQNQEKDMSCRACETAKPGAEGNNAKKDGADAGDGQFQFGIEDADEVAAAEKKNGAESAGLDLFGDKIDTSFKGDTSAPSFDDQGASNLGGFNFGSAPIFGDADGSLDFSSAAGGAAPAEGTAAEGDSTAADSWAQGEFSFGNEPAAAPETSLETSLDDAKPEAKGDETDQVLFQGRAKIYEFDSKQSKWCERGAGDLHINKVDGAGGQEKAGRLVLRSSGTKRLVLNCPTHSKMNLKLQGERCVSFISTNSTGDGDADAKIRQFLVKFKTKTNATEAMDKIKSLLP